MTNTQTTKCQTCSAPIMWSETQQKVVHAEYAGYSALRLVPADPSNFDHAA